MKKGDRVRVVQPVIEGTIVGTTYNEEFERLEHTVEWIDGENVHQRRFAATSLVEVPSE